MKSAPKPCENCWISSLNYEYPRPLTRGELAENLDQLYDFVITTVIEANAERDVEKFQQALNVLDVLRDGFSQAANKLLRTQKSSNRLGKR